MKRSIYVVDDQAAVMEMTVIVLRRMNKEWEATGFTDPFAALEAIKAKAPDAVLTDQIMPGMQGSKLLEEVRAISPTTLRLIMSGCVGLDKLTLITSAHQYIAKPFDPVMLRDLVQRSFAAQDRIVDRGLQKVATSIRSIPSLPQAHHALLAELENNQAPSECIARLIGDDPGLSVKVLQLANSGLFGHGYVVTNLVDAVGCLGTDMITAVLLSQSVFRHYEPLKQQGIDLTKVWAHCWETACIAQGLCLEQKLPRQTGEEAFLAGLLHEVGRFLLIDNFPEQYQTACEEAIRDKSPLAGRLGEVFQASPCQLSAYVLELWGLPPAVVHSISLLDTPEEDPSAEFSMTSALYIADHLATRKTSPDSSPAEPWKTAYLDAIGCTAEIPAWEEKAMNPGGFTQL